MDKKHVIDKWIWIVLICALILFIYNSSIKKESQICTESDNGNIYIKGTCYDGNAYSDICRIDKGPILIESTCSVGGQCISKMINCEINCDNGACINE